MSAELFSGIDLPCGKTVRNRLVKVALYEHLATFSGGTPNKLHYALYSTWSKSEWGMIMTGNVQVSPTHLSLGRDMIVPADITPETMKPFEKLAKAIRGISHSSGRPLAIMQLNHTGRQAATVIGGSYPWRRPLAPSEVRVFPKGQGYLTNALHYVAFQMPKAMSMPEIDEVVNSFVRGAELASQSGFDGIQIHAAHGYLLAQFISAKTNKRQDEYSVYSENALRLLHRIVQSIRAVVPSDFALGIKINAADYTANGLENDVARIQAHVLSIATWGGVDFVEISGGDYESPEFIQGPKQVHSHRQALFSHFSKAAMSVINDLPRKNYPPPLILLTGGLRSPELIHGALFAGHAHLLGIGRAAILNPDLPKILKSQLLADSSKCRMHMRSEPDLTPSLRFISHLASCLPKIPLIGAGVNLAWYTVAMRRIACASAAARARRTTATAKCDVGNPDDQILVKENGMGEEIEDLEKVEPDYTVGAVSALVRMWAWVNFAGS